jgi:uncharacterized protein YicC (UPF0701 family)
MRKKASKAKRKGTATAGLAKTHASRADAKIELVRLKADMEDEIRRLRAEVGELRQLVRLAGNPTVGRRRKSQKTA